MNEGEPGLQHFIATITAERFTEYEVMDFAAHWDSDYHQPPHYGRQLVLTGSVALEMDGRVATFAAGDTYDVPENTRHREVFGPAGASLCIARRKQGEAPLGDRPDAARTPAVR